MLEQATEKVGEALSLDQRRWGGCSDLLVKISVVWSCLLYQWSRRVRLLGESCRVG